MTSHIGTHEAMSRYILFAIIATVANIAAQEGVLVLAPAAPLMASILAGTIVGFAIKYVLDKFYVFNDGYDGHAREAAKIALYGVFSVVTTLIFWGVELAAWSIWGTSVAKYAGAVAGLTIGYVLKFFLDRHFVFQKGAA